MGDILSQEEIDALLSAVSDGDDFNDEPEVALGSDNGAMDLGLESSLSSDSMFSSTPAVDSASYTPPAGFYDDDEEDDDLDNKVLSLYDFRRPDRVSKDQMRTIQNLHEGYARILSTTLTNYLRTFVEIEVVSVDQLTYSEFIMSISNPSCIHLFKMEPIEVTAIFEMNPSLVFFIIDRLFGGLGRSNEQNRELTSIEQNVIRSIVSRGLDDLSSVWEHMGAFSPKITDYETNPMFVQIAPPGETVILITFEVHMLKSSGLMSICFPHQIIEQVFSRMGSQNWLSMQKQTNPETRELMVQEIQELPVPLSVLVGQTSISVRDLLQLQQGDILCLDKHTESDLVVQVGGISKMGGKSGIVGRKKAVRITEVWEESLLEEEGDDDE